MRGQLFIVRPHTRNLICDRVQSLPEGFEVVLREPKRTLDQNAKLWAMLSDISRAAPDGRRHSPEVWKQLAMHACGHEVFFVAGLNGEPFPTGLRSSRLSKAQMSELIEFLYEYGSRHEIKWSDEHVRA